MTTMREEYELNAPACPDPHERIAELEREVARLTAHLTQPAQAVDVGDQVLREMCRAYEVECHSLADFIPNERGIAAMRAAYTRALAGEQAGWRDIAAAPKDGPWWLLWDAGYGIPTVSTHRMDDGTFWEGDWDRKIDASHWQPLPTSPTDKDQR